MNKLREQYEATGVMTETGVKYFKYTYTQWLEARDEEHLTKIEKEVRHRKRYQQKCTDLLSEAKKMEKDLAFSVKYRNKLEKALFEGGEHPELPTLKQSYENAYTEIEGLEKEIKPLRLMKQNDDDIISGYENAHINMEHELSTLRQFIEDAPVIEIEWDEDGNLFESKSGGFIEYEGFVKGGKPHIPIKVRLVEVEK